MARSSKKGKTKRSSRKSRKTGTRAPIDRARLGRILVVVAWVAVIGGLGVGWAVGVPSLRAYAGEQLKRDVDAVEIRFADLPQWLAGADDELTEIENAVRDSLNGDPLDRGVLVEARRRLQRTGWFESVDRVQRLDPGVIEVRATYVRPFTLIEDREGNHLVTADGRLLPKRYPAGVQLRATPRIVGARFRRPLRAGERWEGKDVAAGLRLAALLAPRTWVQQVVAIDVSEFMQTESVWLITDSGSRILWGRVPGEERGVEVPAKQKLAYLDYFYNQSGRIDRGLRELDLGLDVVYAPAGDPDRP